MTATDPPEAEWDGWVGKIARKTTGGHVAGAYEEGDHGHRGLSRRDVDDRPQPLRLLQSGDRVGEL
ncbi:hypothetical protein ACWEFL_34225, partial [Streptomyces sp. NPDC004838]